MASATSRKRAYYALAILLGIVVLGSLASAHRRLVWLRSGSSASLAQQQVSEQSLETSSRYTDALHRAVLASKLSYAAPWTPLPPFSMRVRRTSPLCPVCSKAAGRSGVR
ncbi:hypothetical protein BCR35DRAFT_179609 [Leucosporidium creatinivorum]|uniref:Uncharacterized protein n=1 Tax=Leucosporidium creatinivorum TaxID=106004 RepID=A0A1Y2E5X6_9BASI|nr:hypothetical protein BCR35DRAFT_179609 [Leucosporidium creatinivorum]